MSLKLYVVDLRGYEREEYIRLYESLDRWKWTISDCSEPKMYLVTWNMEQSMSEVTGIPADRVREIHNI